MATLACIGLLASAAGPAAPHWERPHWEGTRLAEVGVSSNSDYVRSVSYGYGILRDATRVPFEPWYGGDALPDLKFAFLTPVGPDVGFLWGFGTGDSGEKYWIEPSLKLGFIARRPLSEHAEIVGRMSFVIGGRLRERTCIADYGAIGGVQTVNCRLADSPLRPEDTLDFLFDRRPGDQVELSLRLNIRF